MITEKKSMAVMISTTIFTTLRTVTIER